jgi:hypothetical protein
MADDKSKRGPQDRSRINTAEDYEVRYWKSGERFGQPLLARAIGCQRNCRQRPR